MNLLALIVLTLQLSLLVFVAWGDVASRTISDRICLALALIGATSQLLIGPLHLAESFGVAVALFLALLWLYSRHTLGGGDVKLLVALSLGLPFIGVVQLVAITGLAGGVLALAYLAMRYLPRPNLPTTRSIIRRVYAVERWRILRHGPLPYGVAIASGGTWAILVQAGI